MTELLCARSRLAVGAPDLIIDGRLAFSRHGLLISLAFAAMRRVWLVPAIWALLQRFEIIEFPEFGDERENSADMLAALREWHAVWTGGCQLEQLCWIGDMKVESRLPPGFDHAAARRLPYFAVLLEQLAAIEGPVSSLTVCARDAAALAAVQAIEAPVILTSLDRPPPKICRFLKAAGVPCSALEGAAARSLARAALGPEPPHGVLLAMHGGARLAAVAVLAPRAMAALQRAEPDFEPEDMPYAEEQDPWREARAFWCEVRP